MASGILSRRNALASSNCLRSSTRLDARFTAARSELSSIAPYNSWAVWKTYVRRPETDPLRQMAMNQLGNGLYDAESHEDALNVREAELSTLRRLGDSEANILVVQTNLANTYRSFGRLEEALRINREIYARRSKLYGRDNEPTLISAVNLASTLVDELQQFDEARRFARQNTRGRPSSREGSWAYFQVAADARTMPLRKR